MFVVHRLVNLGSGQWSCCLGLAVFGGLLRPIGDLGFGPFGKIIITSNTSNLIKILND